MKNKLLLTDYLALLSTQILDVWKLRKVTTLIKGVINSKSLRINLISEATK